MDSIDTTTDSVTKKGLNRRQVIVGGAVGAAAVWTVPLIDSTPAYGAPVTGSNITSTCSYFVLVYTVEENGVLIGTFADRIGSDGHCAGNTTSTDVLWCWNCDGTHLYDNDPLGSAPHVLRLNGTPLTSSGCTAGQYFTVSGNTITPVSTGTQTVTIVFAVAHAGSLNNTTGQDPGTATGVGDACNNGASQDKVNVACPPISTASFDCLPNG
jgi:hypothetical protein